MPDGEIEVLNSFLCLLCSVCCTEAENSHAGVYVSVYGLGFAIVEVLSATQTVLVFVVGSSTELKKRRNFLLLLQPGLTSTSLSAVSCGLQFLDTFASVWVVKISVCSPPLACLSRK